MKQLQDICTSLELSKELKEAGYPQESLFYWVYDVVLEKRVVKDIKNYTWDGDKKHEPFTAPTVAELGEALPTGVTTHKDGESKEWDCHTWRGGDPTKGRYTHGDSEANARAKMWLYLKKEGLLSEN